MNRYAYEQEMRRREYVAQQREMAFRAEMQRRRHMEMEHRRRMEMRQHEMATRGRYGPPPDAVDQCCPGCCIM